MKKLMIPLTGDKFSRAMLKATEVFDELVIKPVPEMSNLFAVASDHSIHFVEYISRFVERPLAACDCEAGKRGNPCYAMAAVEIHLAVEAAPEVYAEPLGVESRN